YGTTGTGGLTGQGAGPHNSSLANKMDPRVDSTTGYSTGTAGTGTTGAYGHGVQGSSGVTGATMAGGPGPAPNTAGPHKSDIANKMDPRVDSDLDGSRTMGMDQTYSGSGSAV